MMEPIVLAQTVLVEPKPAFAAAAAIVVVVAVVFFAVVAAINRPRRPRSGPAVMDLGDEPPAIVDVLTDRFDVTPEAVPATLVDLAARRWIRLEEVTPGQTVCRLRRRDGEGALTAYERMVLDHVRELAVDGEVPAPALTTGPEGASRSWWRRFRRAVLQDARHQGLARRRWPKGYGIAGLLAAGAAGGLLWASTTDVGENELRITPVFGAAIAGVALLVLISSRLFFSERHRDTPEGLRSASRWIGIRDYLADHGRFEVQGPAAVAIWDRYLAYATALDLAPRVVQQLPLGAEDDVQAWSSVGGRWRQVTVDYGKLRPGWGHHPVWAALSGLVVAAATGYGAWWLGAYTNDVARYDPIAELEADQQQWVRRAALVGAIVLGTLALWWLVRGWNGIAGIIGRRQMTGRVIRKRLRGGHDLSGAIPIDDRGRPLVRPSGVDVSARSERSVRRCLAIDEGTAPEIVAFRATPDDYDAVQQGDDVVGRVAPRTGYLFSVERVARTTAPGAVTSADTAAPATGTEGVDPDLLAAAGRLAAGHAEGRTD